MTRRDYFGVAALLLLVFLAFIMLDRRHAAHYAELNRRHEQAMALVSAQGALTDRRLTGALAELDRRYAHAMDLLMAQREALIAARQRNPVVDTIIVVERVVINKGVAQEGRAADSANTLVSQLAAAATARDSIPVLLKMLEAGGQTHDSLAGLSAEAVELTRAQRDSLDAAEQRSGGIDTIVAVEPDATNKEAVQVQRLADSIIALSPQPGAPASVHDSVPIQLNTIEADPGQTIDSLAGQLLNVAARNGRSLDVDAGSTVALVFNVANPGGSLLSVDGKIAVPPGLFAPFAETPFDLEPDESAIRVVAVTVPTSTRAGQYVVRYLADTPGGAAGAASDSVILVVQPRQEVQMELESAPRFVAAGDSYRVAFVLRNLGNDDVEGRFAVKSNDGLVAELDSAEIRVQPGGRRILGVTVATDPLLAETKVHRLRVTAHLNGVEQEIPVATSLVAMVPRKASHLPARLRFPMELRLGAGLPFGADSPYQISGSGPLTTDGSLFVDVLARGPQRGLSLNGEREEYRLELRSERFGLRAGDHVFGLSPLSQTGRYAVGVEGRARLGDFTVGGFVNRPRRSQFEERAVFLSAQTAGGSIFSLNGLNRVGGDPGSLVTLRGVVPLPGASADVEYGRGIGDHGAASAASARVAGQVKWATYDVQSMRASADYPGSHGGVRRDFASLGLRPWGDLRIGLLLGRDDHDRLPGGISSPHQVRRGWASVAYGDVSLEYQRNSYGFSSGLNPVSDRRGESIRLRLRRRIGNLTLFPLLERGLSWDRLADTRTPFHRIGLRTSFRSNGGLYAYASADYFTGGVASLATGPRVSASLYLAAPIFESTRFNVAVTGLRQLGLPGAVQGTVDATIEQRLPGGHRLSLRVRAKSQRLAVGQSQKRVLLEYAMPVGLPLPRIESDTRIEGRVVDAETGQGLANVLVRLGAETVVTDASGHWLFADLMPGTYFVELDQAGLGDRVVLGVSPLAVVAVEGTTTEVVFRVARGGSISGRLLLEPVTALDSAAVGMGLDRTAPVGVANAVVELQGEETAVTRVTDAWGRFQAVGLPAGRWTLRVADAALPRHWSFRQDSLVVDLLPGVAEEIVLQSGPNERPVRIIAVGEVARENPPPEPRLSALPYAPGQYSVTERGQRLEVIALEVYGDASLWPKIWLANRALLEGRTELRPGMILQIPAKAPLTFDEQAVFDNVPFPR